MAADGHDEVGKEQRELSRRRFLRHAGVAAAAVPVYGGLAEILGAQGASAATYKRNDDNAFFASHPKYKFVMVGVQHRHRRQGERHRVLPDRQHRLQRPR